MFDQIIKVISTAAAIFAAFWGLYLFNKQQKFKRLQNLSALWKEFSKNDELLNLFSLLNEVEIDPAKAGLLEQTSAKSKLQFLAVIEEVALYAEQFEVDRPYAGYLFQWHFYFVYHSASTSARFWENLGGNEEMNAPYWSKSRLLASNKMFTPQPS